MPCSSLTLTLCRRPVEEEASGGEKKKVSKNANFHRSTLLTQPLAFCGKKRSDSSKVSE
jgi:hypothetical protein